MKKGSAYKVKFRRLRQGFTNYSKRKHLIATQIPRIVVRKSNRYVAASIVKNMPKGDVTLCTVTSKELVKVGWKLSFTNSMAFYLTGIIFAQKAKKKGVDRAILDMGLYSNTKGCNIYALCKGASEVGLTINVAKEVIPSGDRISGKVISSYYNKILSVDQEVTQFNQYRKIGIEPQNIETYFDETKQKLLKVPEEGGMS